MEHRGTPQNLSLRHVSGEETGRAERQGERRRQTGNVTRAQRGRGAAIANRIDAPVGSYAYSISFSDGHSSGIFPFALLHDKTAKGS